LKSIPLNELGSFLQTFSQVSNLSDDDILAIRRKSDFLPEIIPDDDEAVDPIKDDEQIEEEAEEVEGDTETEDETPAELATRNFVVSEDETVANIFDEAEFDPEKLSARVLRMLQKDNPDLAVLYNATRVAEDE